MSSRTRTVTGLIEKPDGTPWASARVLFTLTPGSFDSDSQFPSAVVKTRTGADGTFSVVLWCNEDGSAESAYECELPGGETATFTLPYGDGSPVTLSVCRSAGVSPTSAQGASVLALIESELADAIAATDAAASAAAAANSAAASADATRTATEAVRVATDQVRQDTLTAKAATEAATTAATTATGAATSAAGAANAAAAAAPRWMGPWSAVTAYVLGDEVSRLGSSYVAKGSSTNHAPESSPVDWDVVASKGDQGNQGNVGPSGTANDTYDLPTMAVGRPAASEVIFRFKACRAFSLPAGLSGTQTSGEVAATASAAFSVQKNGVEFGTLTWAAAGTVAALASTSGATFAIGDKLTIVAPATQDATLADLSITLKGTTS